MKDKKVILIHGHNSSPQKEKYQIISEKLDELGVDYSIPIFPGGEYPHSKDWLEIIEREVKRSEKPIVLVGHSLGTRAILLYLDKFEREIDSVVLISSFSNNFEKNRKRRDGNYADFFDCAVDTEKVKKLADRFVVVHSEDDDLINYEQGVEIAEELDAELISFEDMGHFSGGEGAEEKAKYFVKFIKSVL